jgi:peroxiredoxin family protein
VKQQEGEEKEPEQLRQERQELLTNYIDNDYKSSSQNFVQLLKDKKLNGRVKVFKQCTMTRKQPSMLECA